MYQFLTQFVRSGPTLTQPWQRKTPRYCSLWSDYFSQSPFNAVSKKDTQSLPQTLLQMPSQTSLRRHRTDQRQMGTVFVPGGNYEKRWVLCNPDISDRIPMGYTTMANDPALYPGYYRSTDRVWENARIVANDSYACPNPNCSCFWPKGFTACVTCGCKFTFELFIGPT